MKYWSKYYGCWREEEDNDIPNDMSNDCSNDCEDDGPESNESEEGNPTILNWTDKEREWWKKLGEDLDKKFSKPKDTSSDFEDDLLNALGDDYFMHSMTSYEHKKWKELAEEIENTGGKPKDANSDFEDDLFTEFKDEANLQSFEDKEVGCSKGVEQRINNIDSKFNKEED